MTVESARQLHGQAEVAREQDRHLDALKLYEEAILGYQASGNTKGVADALQGRVLTYKHLFLLTGDKTYAIIARQNALASLELAQAGNIQNFLHTCYFRLGEIAQLFDDHTEASEYFQKALQEYSGTQCEKGDYTYHLGRALWESGQTHEGKQKLLEGLKMIQENAREVDPFLSHVWESGAHMTIAGALHKSEPELADNHLAKAKVIIDSDPRLIIRKRQWEELAQKLHHS